MAVTQQSKSLEGAEILAKCVLFQALDQPARQRLLERSHRRAYAAREKIFGFGDPGQSMMAVLSGVVRISRPTVGDKKIILGEIQAGDIVGEMALLDGRDRSAEAVAASKCELLILERRDVLPFLEQHPQVCLRLLEILCGKLRISDERMSDIGFAGLEVRLAKALIQRAPDASRTAKFSYSQSELADMIGGTRESVNRQLRAWEKKGTIELRAGWIIVNDRDALTGIAGGG